MKTALALSLVVIATLFLPSCTAKVEKMNDPLLGKIFNSQNLQEVSFDAIIQQMLDSEVIYLGEKHDNPEHHRIQLKIIAELIKQGKRPALGIELFSVDQTGYLMQYVQSGTGSGHQSTSTGSSQAEIKLLRRNLGWQYHADQMWHDYFSLIDVAKKNNLMIFGADLPKGIIRRITRSNISQLTSVERSFLQTSNFQDDEYRQLMFAKLKAAHCGFMQEKRQQLMYQTWLARNDAMSQAILKTLEDQLTEPVLMIMGGGHSEYNMGVYERVAFLRNGVKQLNLGILEIAHKQIPLKQYMQRERIGEREFLPSYEFIWFTPRVDYEDPCLKYKKMLEKMKQ